MQAAGEAVSVAGFLLVELATRVQFAKHQLNRRPAFFRMNLDRDTAPVVGNLDHPAGADPDGDFFGKACQCFIGSVINDFLNDVGRAGCPGVHAGTFLDGFKVFQDTD